MPILHCHFGSAPQLKFAYDVENRTQLPAPEATPQIEGTPTPSLEHIAGPMRAQVESIVGPEFKLYDTKTEDGQRGLIENLAESWGDSIDKLTAALSILLGRFFPKSELASAISDASLRREAEEQEREKGEEGTKIQIDGTKPREVTRRSWNRAEHCGSVLQQHPNWNTYINQAAQKWKLPPALLVTFAEMESGWNPNSGPEYISPNGTVATTTRLRRENGENIFRVTYGDGNGHKIQEEMPQSLLTKSNGFKMTTSAHGLAQAMQKSVPKYRQERHAAFLAEHGYASNTALDLYDPETSIDFLAWHLDEIVQGVNGTINKAGTERGFSPEWKLTPQSDPKWFYMAYNNGAMGYLVLRRYLESKTDAERTQNFSKLTWFQQRPEDYRKRGSDEKGSPGHSDGDKRAQYASRVADVHAAVAKHLNI